mmetsp:Transcript_9178/g.15449  ORF Transcript_9178/g.15449 Transcript_9178/m.15449 type:complete len:163 (+) Transcript_9178:497-985(+)
MMKSYENQKKLLNSEFNQEREYFFDEGLGESLDQHVANLKASFPSIRVETRRDSDGFALVKVILLPNYSYKLDKILSLDPEKALRIQNETMDAIIGTFLPKDPQNFIKSLASPHHEVDPLTVGQLSKIKDLIRERYFGELQDDFEGFKAQLAEIKEHGAGEA